MKYNDLIKLEKQKISAAKKQIKLSEKLILKYQDKAKAEKKRYKEFLKMQKEFSHETERIKNQDMYQKQQQDKSVETERDKEFVSLEELNKTSKIDEFKNKIGMK